MKTIKVLLFQFLIISQLSAYSQNAYEIVRKMDDKVKGQSTQAEITIKIIRPKWERELSMKLWTKGFDFSMVLVFAPTKEKGNAFLKRKKEVWNWIPGIEKIIKLPPSMMSQSWMGTDFTNDDLVKHNSVLNDYSHKIIGETEIDGSTCYKIEMLPKPESSVIWGKIISYIDKKEYIQRRAEFYDEENVLVNLLKGTDVKILGGKKLVSKIEMTPVEKPGFKTILIYNSLLFDKHIEDNFFNPEKMKNLN